MLGNKHAGGEAVGGVAGEHRDLDLPKDRTRIDLVADQVNGSARGRLANRKHRVVRSQAGMAGEQ